ncbi:hypothetical protein [Edwardsiella ictaluri]|uniref:hypothetical protein n=1 Tax=Edwardsiella ictaluri TaxID=67780 RepID=UPI0037832732
MADPHSDQLSKWHSLLKANRYWLLITLGYLALAEQPYRLALRLDPLNGRVLRKFVSIYQQKSPDKTLAYL